jgi:hypothetical protein
MTYVLTPAMCWCQYFYQTYPKERAATFYSITDDKNSVVISTGKKCDLWECSEVTSFDYLGNRIWNTEFIHTDVGSSTLLLLNDTLYVGGNYNPGQAKSVINRMRLDGSVIDEHIYSDPLNRFERSLINLLYSDNNVLYLSGGSYKDNGSNGSTSKGLIYSINKSMDLNICYVDTIQDNSVVLDAHVGSDSLLTCFIMESGFSAPRDRRRIEKYDQDLNLVWKYQPPDSLLILGNDVFLHGSVLRNGNIFFIYYKLGWNDRLPNLRCIDTVSKQTVWEYDFTDISSHGREVFRTKELENGDILIIGKYATLATQPRITGSPWLMKLDKLGNKKWERAYVEVTTSGSDKRGTLWDAVELDNGDIMACGFVVNNNKWDPLLIRTDADGCMDQGQANCPQVQIIDLMSGAVDEIGDAKTIIYPNPSYTAELTIDIPNYDAEYSYSYSIQSASGVIVNKGLLSQKVNDLSLDVSSGVYFVSLIQEGKLIDTQKWIVIR